MNSDNAPVPQKRRSKFARVLTVLVLLAIGGMFFLNSEHQKLIETCNFRKADPQEKLAACDTLLTWTAHEPSTRSLIYRHKMRVYMLQEDWDAAQREADFAVAADPDNPVPWQWQATIFAKAEDYPAALQSIGKALILDAGNDFSLETKAKLLRRMDRWDDLEQLVDDSVRNYQVGAWAWSYSGYFKLRAKEYQASALAFAKALKIDHGNAYYRRKFFEACRGAGADCPLLFFDSIDENFELTCDETFPYLATIFVNWERLKIQESEFDDLQQYFYATPPLRSGIFLEYLDSLSKMESGRVSKNRAEKFRLYSYIVLMLIPARALARQCLGVGFFCRTMRWNQRR